MERRACLAELGEIIRRARWNAGITQEVLAERSGLHSTYIAGIETGKRNPSYIALVAIAKGFGMPLAELLEEARG